MKKMTILLILFFTTLSLVSLAQGFQSGAGFEKGAKGYQYTVQIGVNIKDRITISGYYKSDLNQNYPQFGIVTEVTLLKIKTVALSGQLSTGFVNKQFFVLYPGANINWFITKNIGVSPGFNYRYNKLAYNFKLIFRL